MLLNRICSCFLVAALGSSFVFAAEPVSAQAAPTEFNPDACASQNTGGDLSADCLAMIKAFPHPNVKEISQDKQTLDSYSFWKVGPDAVSEYDSPNGSVVGEIPKGYNFVSAVN